MLSLAVNRRTALLFLGSGAGAVLMSACGGNTSNTESSASPLASSSSASSTSSSSSSENSSSASPSASPSRRNSFQRGFDVELNNADMEYTGEGYMYSTREKPGYGWSHPKRPQEMSENSELGLYYSWAYASAGISYAMKTGDDTYIKQSGMTEGDQKLFKSIALLEETREGKYWEESGNFVYRLESDRPEKKGEEYSWPYQLQMFHGDFYVRNGEVHEIPENTDGWGQTVYSTGTLKARYLDGAWQMEGFFEGIATDVVGKPFDK